MPGRVSSAHAAGSNALIAAGASFVRDAADVLELLGRGPRPAVSRAARHGALEPRLARVLELVDGGRDTPDRLAPACGTPDEVLLALSELELRGLLTRGDGGRYLPSDPA
jgi:predicted Rossmann fold nucleotide-binding protein DprA/Smf involved in DNA uptake